MVNETILPYEMLTTLWNESNLKPLLKHAIPWDIVGYIYIPPE
jgi:hypothetical protein